MQGFYLIIIGLGILIIILSIIEKKIIKNTYAQKYHLHKNTMIRIKTPNINKICFVCDKESQDRVPEKIRKTYIKTIIPIHISDNIEKEVKNTENGLKNIFATPTPINNIIQTITNGFRLLSSADITSMTNLKENKWRIYHPKNTRINCFIEGKYLYIMA